MRLIDADALYNDICFSIDQMTDAGIAVDAEYLWGKLNDALDNAPTIDVVPKDFHDKTCEAMAKRHTEEIQKLMPKRGEWIEPTGDESLSITGRCSNCGWESHLLEDDVVGMPFCPNCGADMRGENNETDKEMR